MNHGQERHLLKTDPARYTDEVESKHHDSRGHEHRHHDYARWDDDGGQQAVR